MAPAGFENCRRRGGKIRTKRVGDGKYIHLCRIDGKWFEGEVKTSKTAAKLARAQRKK